ncbi:MAG: haloalkane dehalogenase [Thalassovita sp.]
MKRRTLLQSMAAVSLVPALPQMASAAPAAMPYSKKFATINGHRMAYVDHGEGRPVVFFHGNPTSSYLWRNVMPHLDKTHRVIAVDMLGMGDSAKPDLAYSYDLQAAHLHGLLDQLDLQDAVLVLHDWGGALGFDYAMKNPARVSAVAFMETVAPPAMPFESYEAMGPFGELFRAWRTPEVGEKMILEDNMFINEILAKQGVATPLSPEVVAHYNSYYPDAASRAPLLAWPRDVPIAGEPANTAALTQNIAGFLTTSEIPKLLLHVTPGALIPPPAVDWMQANVPNLQVKHLGPGAHFIQEDYPDEIGTEIAKWLAQA